MNDSTRDKYLLGCCRHLLMSSYRERSNGTHGTPKFGIVTRSNPQVNYIRSNVTNPLIVSSYARIFV